MKIGMLLYSGIDTEAGEIKSLGKNFTLKKVTSASEAVSFLKDADVFLVGPDIVNSAKEVQKIYAADKHLSVVVLALPIQVKQVKQTIQFSPYVGKNTLVIALNPEIDLAAVCESAANRTRQKRNFHKLNITQKAIAAPVENIKLVQMGSFLEYAPIGAILLNESNQIVSSNRQAKALFPALVAVKVELSLLFAAREADAITAFVYNGHDPQMSEELQVQQKILELTSTEVYNEEGQKHFLLLFNDVTHQRLEMQRIQSILEALPQMAWTADSKGVFTYFTQGWYFYTGQSIDEALYAYWLPVVFPEDRERLSRQWKDSVKTGTPFQQAARFKNTQGEYRWHLARASAIRDKGSQIILWVGTCTDIHDQILLTEELERKVKERTHALEVSNSELEQFAHVSSHDLQEPLRKIRTFSDLLKNKVYKDVDETSKRYLDKISATAERMSDSLKALLNYTSLRREENFITVDLSEIVSQVLVDLELMISQKNAMVTVATLPVVKAVPIQMQQLFYNLMNNALKFSKEDLPPHIEVTSRQLMEEELVQFPQLQRFGEYHEIVVKDNGIGFEQEYEDKVFTIFQRLHSKTEFEGTGIGLSLVKKVVSNHGGKVYVRSKPNEGTTFHVILPG